MPRPTSRPWVGNEYGKSTNRLLVVGESYCAEPDEADAGLSRWLINDWRSGLTDHRYFVRLAELLPDCGEAGRNRSSTFDQIAFYNYIHPLIRVSKDRRIDRDAWVEAREPFLDVMRGLDPTHILITSIGIRKHMPDPVAISIEPLSKLECTVFDYSVNSGRARAIAIPHPNRAPFEKWTAVVAAFLQLSP